MALILSNIAPTFYLTEYTLPKSTFHNTDTIKR